MSASSVAESISGHKISILIDPVADLGIKPGAEGVIGRDFDYTFTVRVKRNDTNPQKGLLTATISEVGK